jgi:[acyl-carrier-protein] S-malonyltransferase
MINWQSAALVFPGQGSQEVGMGADLVAAFPQARAIFAQADDLLGFALSDLCFRGPAEVLNDTLHTQPALFVMGIALLRVLEEALGASFQPACAAGHSLGELTALAAAGAMTFEDGLRLVRERGRLMQEASRRTPGAMAAVLGLDTDMLTALCNEASAQTGRPLVIANDNCPGQIVISGDRPTLELAVPLLERAGAKRVVPLAVSVASHSPLMQSITAEFAQALAATPLSAPQLPVIGNVDAAPLESAEAIRAELGAQLVSTVRWTESVEVMRARGVETFIEVGPKDVLSGLIKRLDRTAQRYTLNSAASVEAFLREAVAGE